MMKVKFSDVVQRAHTKEDRFSTDKIYYTGGEHIDTDDVIVSKRGIIKGSTIGPMFYCGFIAGDILFVTRNPHLRKCGIATYDGICSEKTFVLRTKNEEILLQDYLLFVMHTTKFWNYLETNKSGSVNFFINWSTLAKYEFELPGLEEQFKVVQLLKTIVELKHKYTLLINSTDELVKSQFIEMFGTMNAPKENCSYVELKHICTKDSSNISMKSVENDTGDYPLYGAAGFVKNISNYKMDKTYVAVIKDGAGVGRVQLLPAYTSIINTMQYIIPVQGILPEYLASLLSMLDLGKECIGTTIPHIYFKNYGEKIVPKPSLEQQKQFATFVQQVDKSKFKLQKSIETLDTLQKSIMRKYLG